MAAAAAIPIAIAVAQAAKSWWEQQNAAATAKSVYREQARRLEAQHAQTLGQATAAGAASGIEFDSGSLQAHLSAMSEEFKRQEDLVRRAGLGAAASLRTAGNWNAAADVGGALFRYGADNNWFQQSQLTTGTK